MPIHTLDDDLNHNLATFKKIWIIEYCLNVWCVDIKVGYGWSGSYKIGCLKCFILFECYTSYIENKYIRLCSWNVYTINAINTTSYVPWRYIYIYIRQWLGSRKAYADEFNHIQLKQCILLSYSETEEAGDLNEHTHGVNVIQCG